MKGTIKFFKEDKGYGFIAGDDGTDVFLHVSKIEGFTGRDYPTVGRRVDYQTIDTDRGIQAVHVYLEQ